MKFLIRCDSSFNIGSGHLTRCINLAKKLNGDVHFLCRNLPGNLNSRVTINQFHLHKIPSEDIKVEQTIEESKLITPILREIQPNTVIVDHYGLDNNWEREASNFANKIVAIDDIRRKHDADGILDQNLRPFTPDNYVDSGSKLFLGPEYCLLSDAFLNSSAPTRRFDSPKSVMVFFGGSDQNSFTLRVLKMVESFREDLKWDIVVGIQNKDLNELEKRSESLKNVRLHLNIDYMHILMSNCDVFFGASGTTSWERAKLGLPSLCISVARNQIELAKNLDSQGACSYLGHFTDLSDKDLKGGLERILSSRSLRQSSYKKSLELNVSGKLNEFVDFLNSET